MKKLDFDQGRGFKSKVVRFFRRFLDCFIYLVAALLCLVAPRLVSNAVHNELRRRYFYVLERDDIGDSAWKRWQKGKGDKLNQADSRKICNVIREYFNIAIGEVK
jgi:hypothetical protein